MRRICFYYHGGSANHGCEAIVRSTVKILHARASLWSAVPDADISCGLRGIVDIFEDTKCPPVGAKLFSFKVHHKLTGSDYLYTKFAHESFFSAIQRGNTIGINASPLIMQCAKDGGVAYEAYCRLIERILDTTDATIALIPHVVIENSDDRIPLHSLYEKFASTGRVVLVEDHNCCELKGYISSCRMFIGARTHATIAAYSTCVPTLVLGYSVKSRGIARDIFGTEEHYVLPVQELQDPDELANGFDWLSANEMTVRDHLIKTMPEYKARALLARDAVEELMCR